MVVTIENLVLSQTADSGQCFRWNKISDECYEIIAYGRYLKISQNGNEFNLDCTNQEWDDIWYRYFDMDTDYQTIGRKIRNSNDEYLKEAYSDGWGIRILNQDLWETLISFIISQNNNIKRIKGSIEAICNKASLPVKEGPDGKYRFPGPFEIDGDFFKDKELGLGYRDQYLADMFDYAKDHPEFPENLREMNADDAFVKLKSFTGIGDKVANCVCLFGLHNVDAFPIDTHIRQILDMYYHDGFDYERYKGYAGIVQQYMFNHKVNKRK